MSLLERIKNDQISARKEKTKDQIKIALLTTLYSDVLSVGKKSQRDATDDEIIQILKQYRVRNSDTLLVHGLSKEARDKLNAEIKILDLYIPAQMTREQLSEQISLYITQQNKKDIGSIMKFLKENFSGRYDSRLASELIKEL